jgi:DNA-binding response OmpR family regulator
MSKPEPTTSDEIAALLKAVLDGGRVVIVPTQASVLTAPPLRGDTESALVATCRTVFALTPAEARAFVQLVKHEQVAKTDLHAAISAAGKPPTNVKIVDVVVGQLRKKLGPHGIQIDVIYGWGFKLADGARDRVRKLLAEYGGDVLVAATPPRAPPP